MHIEVQHRERQRTKRISQMKHSITSRVRLWLWSQKGCFIAHNYHYQPGSFGFLLCSHSDNAPPVQIPTQPLLLSDSHTQKPIDLLPSKLIVLTGVDSKLGHSNAVTVIQIRCSMNYSSHLLYDDSYCQMNITFWSQVYVQSVWLEKQRDRFI